MGFMIGMDIDGMAFSVYILVAWPGMAGVVDKERKGTRRLYIAVTSPTDINTNETLHIYTYAAKKLMVLSFATQRYGEVKKKASTSVHYR